jgi:O-methyltransferase
MDNTLITQDRLNMIMQWAAMSPAEGLFAECGVYKGGSLKFLAEKFKWRTCLGFDTFEGLPVEHWQQGEVHQPGDFSDTNVLEVREFINCNNVVLFKGSFPECIRGLLDYNEFAFVHVDFDLKSSVQSALDWFWPRLLKGGSMVFDDFGWYKCPGVEEALIAFADAQKIKIIDGAQYQAVLVKPYNLQSIGGSRA